MIMYIARDVNEHSTIWGTGETVTDALEQGQKYVKSFYDKEKIPHIQLEVIKAEEPLLDYVDDMGGENVPYFIDTDGVAKLQVSKGSLSDTELLDYLLKCGIEFTISDDRRIKNRESILECMGKKLDIKE